MKSLLFSVCLFGGCGPLGRQKLPLIDAVYPQVVR